MPSRDLPPLPAAVPPPPAARPENALNGRDAIKEKKRLKDPNKMRIHFFKQQIRGGGNDVTLNLTLTY